MKRPEVVRGYITPWVKWADWLEAERAKDREAMQAVVDAEVIYGEEVHLIAARDALAKRLEE